MSGAYTPGLTVSARTTIIKTRRLPLKGTVLSTTGTWVAPADKVARAELPGIMQPIKVASKLGIEPSEVPALLTVKVGDKVLFAKYSGTEYKVDEVDYLVLAEKDILGVIQG